MPNVLGSIAVSLGLDAVEFTQGLTKAEYEAKKATAAIAASFEGVKRSVETLAGLAGVAFGVSEIKEWAAGILDGAEQLHNLSLETGSSIEQLSKLENAAKLSGTSFDTLKTTLDKFAAGLGGVEGQGGRVSEVMKLLGVSAKDPAEALLQTAQKMAQFADGANKAALARETFGRGGVAFISALKSINEESGIAATKTAEQVEAAVKLAEAYRLLTIQSHQLRDAFLEGIVPALTELVTKFNEAKRASDSFHETIAVFGNLLNFKTPAEQVDDLNKKIKETQQLIDDVKGGKTFFSKFGFGTDTTNLEANLAEYKKSLSIAQDAFIRSVGGPPTIPEGKRPAAPKLPPVGESDALAKKLLEGQLKAFENSIKSEQDQLKNREAFLQAYFSADLISIRDFYGTRQTVIADALAEQVKAYDGEIAALRRYQATAAKGSDRAEAETKIADAVAKRAKLEQQAATDSALLFLEERAAVKALTNDINGLGISLQGLRGDAAGAAAAGFELQNQKLRDQLRLLKETGDEEQRNLALRGTAYLDELKARTVAQAELNKQTQSYSNVVDILAIKQGRIDLLQQSGALTEIDAIIKRQDLAREYITILERQADAVAKAAQNLGEGPDKDAALIRVQQLRLEIDRLAVSTNALADKFKDAFAGPFESALDKLIDRTSSLRDILKGLEKDIVGNLFKIASKDVTEQLFGKDGAFGGIGKLFAGLFSTGKSSGSTPADAALTALATTTTATDSSLVAMSATSTAATAAITSMAAAATTAAAALATVGASSAASGPAGAAGDFSGLADFSAIGTFANGTNYAPGGLAIVGERGKELVNLPRGAQVIPNHELMSRRVANGDTHISVVVQGNATRDTADQIASQVETRLRRAQRIR